MPLSPALHVHAPEPRDVVAVDTWNCPARAGDGRRCGGRRAVVRLFDWYDPMAVCVARGRAFTAGHQHPGRVNVKLYRALWLALSEVKG